MSEKKMWDQRYSAKEFVYGKEPNDFLVQIAEHIPKGKILCLAEGEGRNAVYLAGIGHDVYAVDFSPAGLHKTILLAKERSVKIKTFLADLADFKIEIGTWDAIVCFFCHLSPKLRQNLHRKIMLGLRRGGVFVLESYSSAQLKLKTGGPRTEELLLDLKTIKKELFGLDFKIALEKERNVFEGKYHNGPGAVIQVYAVKPQ